MLTWVRHVASTSECPALALSIQVHLIICYCINLSVWPHSYKELMADLASDFYNVQVIRISSRHCLVISDRWLGPFYPIITFLGMFVCVIPAFVLRVCCGTSSGDLIWDLILLFRWYFELILLYLGTSTKILLSKKAALTRFVKCLKSEKKLNQPYPASLPIKNSD